MAFFKIELKKKSSAAKLDCESCGLYKDCHSPKMEFSGKGKKKILIISDYPTDTGDKKGLPLSGEGLLILKSAIKEAGYNFDKDCWITNSVKCYPGYDQKKEKENIPTTIQVNSCRIKLKETIAELKPKKIILIGRLSVTAFLGDRMNDLGKMDRWVGWSIPDQKYQCWVYPTYHPDYLVDAPNDKALENEFYKNINNALNHKSFHKENKFPDLSNYESQTTSLTETNEIIEFLETILNEKNDYLVFDYETTGLRPYAKGHKIVYISFCTSHDQSVSFLNDPDWRVQGLIKEILANKRIGKIAHNIKFEYMWTKQIFGYDVVNWKWDTMVAAHVLDSRSHITGLKFQTYIRYGICGYDNEIESYLKSGSKNIHAFNKIEDAPQDKALLYSALDSLFTYWLFSDQKSLIEQWNYKLLHEGLETFMDIHENGIPINVDYFNNSIKRLGKSIDRLKDKLSNSEEIIKWNKRHDKPLNIDSPKQLGELFFDQLKLKSTKKTASGKQAVDDEVLQKINNPIAKQILGIKSQSKLKETYLEGFLRSSFDGFLRPDFNLQIAKTFRSSSSNPNFQNVPKRDEKAQKLIRSGIVPHPGQILMLADYSGVEVRASCFYHKDPNLLNYVCDPETDMHGDEALLLFMLDKNQLTKKLRYCTKNKFIFPQFYGDYFASCARELWQSAKEEVTGDGILCVDHLRNMGIRNYKQFENHIKEEENQFWNVKFKVYTQWKKDTYAYYLRHGYVDLLTGFRCGGRMKKNEVLNRQIQGTGFHLLLWSMININKRLKKGKYKSKIIGQIHDEIVFSVDPDELQSVKNMTNRVMTRSVVKHWDWINVPLEIEIELSEVNGNWYNVKVEK